MASWDSADLLSQWNRLCRRPSTDPITDAVKYQMLSRGQSSAIEEVAIRYPDCLYGDPVSLTTSDNKVFTFGTDANGHAVAPMGFVGIYPTLTSIPDSPWRPGMLGDYLDEGTQIRIPNDRSYGGTLYARFIATPADITASTQPALQPAPSRRLIVLKAAMEFASEGGGRPEVYAVCEREWDKAFPKWMMLFRTRFRTGGALSVTAAGMLTSSAADFSVISDASDTIITD